MVVKRSPFSTMVVRSPRVFSLLPLRLSQSMPTDLPQSASVTPVLCQRPRPACRICPILKTRFTLSTATTNVAMIHTYDCGRYGLKVGQRLTTRFLMGPARIQLFVWSRVVTFCQ